LATNGPAYFGSPSPTEEETVFRRRRQVVVFALYNGLVFLPVLLSLLGPPPRPDKKFETSGMKEVPMKRLKLAGDAAEAETETFVRPNEENSQQNENGLA
jgi:hypothetical protein